MVLERWDTAFGCMSRRFMPSLAPIGSLITAQPGGLVQTGASGFPEFILLEERSIWTLSLPKERMYACMYVCM